MKILNEFNRVGMNSCGKKMATGHKNGGQKRGLARLTLFVVVELLNAALAASTNSVILSPVLFPPMIFVNRCFQLFFLQPSLFMKSMLLQQVLKDFHQEL